MDRVDRRILQELQRDAAVSNTALADRVGLSPSSCLRRVQRLKEEGIIRRTVAVVDPDKVGRGLTAVVEVMLGHHGQSQRRDFVSRMMREGAVLQAWSVTGEPDVICVIQLRDMKEYQGLADRLFGHDPNVVKFRTYFVMETYKSETVVPIDDLDGGRG